MMTGAERRQLAEQFAAHKPAREAVNEATRAKPVIIEIPFAGRQAEPSAPRCRRLHTDGRQCELPAMEGYQECLRHFRWHTLYVSMHALPLPEDALSLQEVLAYTVDMVLSKRTTGDEARAIAELCRIMEKNLARCEGELEEMRRRQRPGAR